ncbi:MAG: hypothetical protein ACQXXG_02075 [Candidatus Bathyarchaeia archaeon]|jgi:hypothetical protein
MKKSWTWADYELLGSPTITFDDYRIKAYGRDEEIAAFVDELAKYTKKSARMLRKLVAYWGSGKSTFLYNACYNVNQRLFFGDEIENPKEGNFAHALAFFEKVPSKRAKLLDCVYRDGLPWPWDPTTPRNVASEKGMDAWKECLRKLAFIILRRAAHEIQKRRLEQVALGGSKLRKNIYENILSMLEIKTMEFIQKIDELTKANDQTLEECGELMRFYIRMLMPSIEIKKGYRRIVNQDTFEQQFPLFLYPCFSNKFLEAYKELFSTPDVNLSYFPAFERVLKMAQTFLLLVFDEVEDWSVVVRDRIDDDIHDIVVDAESPLSTILIFRTEVLRNIRSETTLGTFMTIYDRLENLTMKQLSKEDIIALTAGILSTVREGEPKIFPFTEGFIVKLASQTKRGGSFNVRTYLRALKMLLTESLEWKREKPLLTADLLEQKKVQDIIKEAVRAEESEAFKFMPAPKRLEE